MATGRYGARRVHGSAWRALLHESWMDHVPMVTPVLTLAGSRREMRWSSYPAVLSASGAMAMF